MKRKSPQEKKALSYAKDRRNVYGENDKASRKNLPRKKRLARQAERHRAKVVLAHASPDDIENELKRERIDRHSSRKWPDAPLAMVVRYKITRRVRKGIIDEAVANAKLARVPPLKDARGQS